MTDYLQKHLTLCLMKEFISEGIFIYNFLCTHFPFHILFLKVSSAQNLFMQALELI